MENEKAPWQATTSLVLAICSFFVVFLAIVAIPLGIYALVKIKKQGLNGKGLAIAGIVTGIVAVIVAVIFLLLSNLLMQSMIDQIEGGFEEERIQRENLKEKCMEITFEIVSVGDCAAASTSCEVTIKRLGGEVDPDKITVIVDDGSNLIGSRLRWDWSGAFNIGQTETIVVSNALENGKLAEDATVVMVYVEAFDNYCKTTEKNL